MRTRPNCLRCLGLALALVATSSCNFGLIADGGTAVVGLIKTSSGEPLDGVSIRITTPGATSGRRVTSASSGCIALSQTHEPGRIDVTIQLEKPGYKPWRYRGAPGLYAADIVMSRDDETSSSMGQLRRLAPEDRQKFPCWLE